MMRTFCLFVLVAGLVAGESKAGLSQGSITLDRPSKNTFEQQTKRDMEVKFDKHNILARDIQQRFGSNSHFAPSTPSSGYHQPSSSSSASSYQQVQQPSTSYTRPHKQEASQEYEEEEEAGDEAILLPVPVPVPGPHHHHQPQHHEHHQHHQHHQHHGHNGRNGHQGHHGLQGYNGHRGHHQKNHYQGHPQAYYGFQQQQTYPFLPYPAPYATPYSAPFYSPYYAPYSDGYSSSYSDSYSYPSAPYQAYRPYPLVHPAKRFISNLLSSRALLPITSGELDNLVETDPILLHLALSKTLSDQYQHRHQSHSQYPQQVPLAALAYLAGSNQQGHNGLDTGHGLSGGVSSSPASLSSLLPALISPRQDNIDDQVAKMLGRLLPSLPNPIINALTNNNNLAGYGR